MAEAVVPVHGVWLHRERDGRGAFSALELARGSPLQTPHACSICTRHTPCGLRARPSRAAPLCVHTSSSARLLTTHTTQVLGTNADAVDILVRHRAWQPSYANIQDAEGDSPLMVAALHGRDEIARMLLEANASTELAGTHPQQGTTALCYAATPNSQGAVTVAEHLLAFGADVQARCDEFGSSPLHLLGNNDWEGAVDMRFSAASRNRHFAYDYPRSMPDHVAVARLLIAHGAKLDALDMFGRTALHRAAANGVTPVGRVLLRAGADATLCDSEGMAALDYAKSQRMVGMQRLLLKAREEEKTEL